MPTLEFMDDYLNKILEDLSFENKHIVLLGDFNIDLLTCESNNSTNDFLDLITSNSLMPLILRPTRITTHSKTLIDNIFTSIIENDNIAGNITCSISDHLAQFIIFKICNQTFIKVPKPPKRNFKNINPELFILDILEVDWSKHLKLNKNDATLSTSKFLNIIDAILDRHAPYMKPSINKKFNTSKPWITLGILTSINK